MSSPSTLTSSAMSRETAPRLTTMSLSAVSRIVWPLQTPLASMSVARFKLEFAAPDLLQRARPVLAGHGGEKAQAAELMPSMGVVRTGNLSRAARSIVPSPPKTSSKSTSRASEAASGR